MSFVDPAFFLVFLPLTLVIFYLAGRWGGPRHAAAASAWFDPVLRAVRVAFPGVDARERAGQRAFLRRADRQGTRKGTTPRPLPDRVAINLLVLAVFKYAPGFTAIPAARAVAPALAPWVPITISFLHLPAAGAVV